MHYKYMIRLYLLMICLSFFFILVPAVERSGVDEKTFSLGIDISVHSGSVDWACFEKDRFDFVYLKASEGLDLVDAAFHAHRLEAKKIGIPTGAYHFFVTEDDASDQAKFFIETVGDDCGTLPPVLDIELIGKNTRGDLASSILNWLMIVEKKYGVKPVIYTSHNFWNAHVKTDFSGYHLWVAEYDVNQPKLPGNWERWTLWQFRENVPLKWVEKGADISRIHPDAVKLFKLDR